MIAEPKDLFPVLYLIIASVRPLCVLVTLVIKSLSAGIAVDQRHLTSVVICPLNLEGYLKLDVSYWSLRCCIADVNPSWRSMYGNRVLLARQTTIRGLVFPSNRDRSLDIPDLIVVDVCACHGS